jgi:hypothetical protein
VSLVNGKVNASAEEYRVLLEASKTDPFRRGVTVRILAPSAVKAMRSHCDGLPSAPLFNDPVFSVTNKSNKSVPLDREAVVQSIKSHLLLIGEPASQYNGHSFRKGGAQSLREANVCDTTIQAMGRWTSDCYKLYITTPIQSITSAALSMEPCNVN